MVCYDLHDGLRVKFDRGIRSGQQFEFFNFLHGCEQVSLDTINQYLEGVRFRMDIRLQHS